MQPFVKYIISFVFLQLASIWTISGSHGYLGAFTCQSLKKRLILKSEADLGYVWPVIGCKIHESFCWIFYPALPILLSRLQEKVS